MVDVRVHHMTMWSVFFAMLYVCFYHVEFIFQNCRKPGFRIFLGNKLLKPWHKRKLNLCGALDHIPLTGSPAAPHLTGHYQNLKSITSNFQQGKNV